MDVSVLVPYAGDDPWRGDAYAWVCARYHALGWETSQGQGDPSAWCKADAVAYALTHANHDLLVVADADVWAQDIADAVGAVAEGPARWAVPYRKVWRLTAAATETVLAGHEPSRDRRTLEQTPYDGVAGGGIVVLARKLYEQVPLDARFVGWGGEDLAWGSALTCLAGAPYRARGPLWHLWHPPQLRMSRKIGNPANEKLRRRYAAAEHRPDEMRALLTEVSNVSCTSAHPPRDARPCRPNS